LTPNDERPLKRFDDGLASDGRGQSQLSAIELATCCVWNASYEWRKTKLIIEKLYGRQLTYWYSQLVPAD
jgi:hypothetical protein